MDQQAKRFLRITLITFVTLLALVVAFNAVVDPYLMVGTPRMSGINAHRTKGVMDMPLLKAYEVFRVRPHTLILGSSRVGFGLDPTSLSWPTADRPVYDLGLLGGDPETAYRYLQNVNETNRLTAVVLGLEFSMFVSSRNAILAQETEAHLSTTRDGRQRSGKTWIYFRDFLDTNFSLSTLLASMSTVYSNISDDSTDIVAGGWNAPEYDQFIARSGVYPFFSEIDLNYFHWYAHRHWRQDSLLSVKAIIEYCQAHGIRLIVVLHPSYVDELEMLDLLGLSGEVEDWKRALVRVTTPYRAAGNHAPLELWDFCEYDSYTTEPAPRGKQSLQWFVDAIHYRPALGEKILQRIFGSGETNFGIALTANNVESHLADIRERRQVYRETRSQDATRVRNVYDAALKWEAREEWPDRTQLAASPATQTPGP